MVITLWTLPYVGVAQPMFGETMSRYIVMNKNKENQWVLFQHTAYRSEESARQVIDKQIDRIVMMALHDAVRMTSAVRGVNREKFMQMQDNVRNARKGFKIIKLGESF